MKSIRCKMFNKLQRMPDSVKASVAFTLCSIIQKGILVISVPIFTRQLSTEEYGIYTIYLSWLGIIQIFATLNIFYGVFNNGLIKYDNHDALTSAMIGLSSAITSVIFFSFILMHSIWERVTTLSFSIIVLIFLQVFFEPAFMFWSARQRFGYKYKKLVLITILMSIFNLIIGIILVSISSNKSLALIFSNVLVYALVGAFFYFYYLKKNRSLLNKKIWKYALWFNLPLLPHYLAGVVLNQADRIMIDYYVNKSAAAIYGVAYTFAFLVNIISNAISSSFLPYTYQRMKVNDYKSIEKNSIPVILVICIPIVFIMAFGPEIIKIFAPDEYYKAIWIIPPVAISAFFSFIYSLFVNIEFYYESNKFIMVGSTLAAILNIILNCIFIPKYGFIAAGYTTLICYIIYMIAHCVFYKIIIKKHDIDRIYNIKMIAIISITALLFMATMLLLYKRIIIRFFIILGMFIIIIIKRNNIYSAIYSLKKNSKGE